MTKGKGVQNASKFDDVIYGRTPILSVDTSKFKNSNSKQFGLRATYSWKDEFFFSEILVKFDVPRVQVSLYGIIKKYGM
jgi:hypothetical protein